MAAEWRFDEESPRPRKYYVLTEAGRRELSGQVEQWWQVSGALSKFLSKEVVV